MCPPVGDSQVYGPSLTPTDVVQKECVEEAAGCTTGIHEVATLCSRTHKIPVSNGRIWVLGRLWSYTVGRRLSCTPSQCWASFDMSHNQPRFTLLPIQSIWPISPLRSRKGMSHLGIPKMGRTSKFLWHKPASPAMGTYVSEARETTTNPRSTGPREALYGLIPGWQRAKHTYGYAY